MSQITTHILDTSLGRPAVGINVYLYVSSEDQWRQIGAGKTNTDGRVGKLTDQQTPLDAGSYKLKFEIDDYYRNREINAFYPYIEIVFQISGDGQHYHVPLLLNPFGYSTYRGS